MATSGEQSSITGATRTPSAGLPDDAERPDDTPPGTRFGAWVVAREIGRGGTSVVFEARHASLGHAVALKRMHHAAALEARQRRRFVREARVLAGLRHPHLVAVHDAGADPHGLWLAMDLLDGETLAARLARAGPLPPAAAAGVGLAVLAALARVHAEGVVHRDVKPANVFLTAGDAMGGVRLLDFGAMHRAPREGESLVTRDGSVVGTPAYMAPEQAEGAAVDARADVFAVAAVLYECVTGRRAFEGRSWARSVAAVLDGRVTPPRRLAPHLSRAFEAAILAGLSGAPAARPPDATTFGDAVARFASAGDRSRWASLTAHLPRTARPARPPSRTALVAATLAAVGAIAALSLGVRTPAPRMPTASATPSRQPPEPRPMSPTSVHPEPPPPSATPSPPEPAPSHREAAPPRRPPRARRLEPARTLTVPSTPPEAPAAPAAPTRVLGWGPNRAVILAPSTAEAAP